MKSIDDHVDDFRMPWGKYKDLPLEETPLDYLDWVVDSEYLNKWQEKLIKTFLKRGDNQIDLDRIIEQKEQDQLEMEAEFDQHF